MEDGDNIEKLRAAYGIDFNRALPQNSNVGEHLPGVAEGSVLDLSDKTHCNMLIATARWWVIGKTNFDGIKACYGGDYSKMGVEVDELMEAILEYFSKNVGIAAYLADLQKRNMIDPSGLVWTDYVPNFEFWLEKMAEKMMRDRVGRSIGEQWEGLGDELPGLSTPDDVLEALRGRHRVPTWYTITGEDPPKR
ncbi:hypothetical protein ACFLY9_01635 [Patescibacteria group bacterium]